MFGARQQFAQILAALQVGEIQSLRGVPRQGERRRSGDDADFRITCSSVPLLKGKEAALRELRSMREGAAKSLNASIEEARNTEVQGQPAIEFTFSFSIDGRNMVSHSRYVRFPKCFYQQIVTVPVGTNVEEDVRRFWESFQVQTD